jgi:hypothetical protein
MPAMTNLHAVRVETRNGARLMVKECDNGGR